MLFILSRKLFLLLLFRPTKKSNFWLLSSYCFDGFFWFFFSSAFLVGPTQKYLVFHNGLRKDFAGETRGFYLQDTTSHVSQRIQVNKCPILHPASSWCPLSSTVYFIPCYKGLLTGIWINPTGRCVCESLRRIKSVLFVWRTRQAVCLTGVILLWLIILPVCSMSKWYCLKENFSGNVPWTPTLETRLKVSMIPVAISY